MTTAYLPNDCYFSQSSPATPASLRSQVIAAGFSNTTNSGSGSKVVGVTVVPPSGPPVEVSPAPQPAPRVLFDVASEVLLTLG